MTKVTPYRGEAFWPDRTRRGDLIGVKPRLEFTAVDRACGRIVACDRQITLGADLAERIAGRNALWRAAPDIAARVFPKVVEQHYRHPMKKRQRNDEIIMDCVFLPGSLRL